MHFEIRERQTMRSNRRALVAAAVVMLAGVACQTNHLTDGSGDELWTAVSPGTALLNAIGATLQLGVVNAHGTPVTVPGLSWRTIESNIVQLDGSGRVTAIAPGTVRVIAETAEHADTATVEVRQTVSVITVSPSPLTVQVATTQQMSAALRDPNGHDIVGRTVTWASSATNIATVTGTGLVTGVAAGGATITASSEGTSGTVSATVTAGPPPPPPPVATVTVAPSSATVGVGSTIQLGTTLHDANGNVLTGRTVTWSSNNTGVATVNGGGVVSGVSQGSATITATSEGETGTSSITVTVSSGATCPQLPSPPPGYCTGTVHVVTPGNVNIPTLAPGDVVVFEDGTYTDTNGDGTVVMIQQGGTSSQYVTFVARNTWGARIDGQNNTSRYGFNFSAVSYVRIEGFDIYGFGSNFAGTVAAPSASGVMIQVGGAFSQIVGNHIHHISNFCNETIRAQTGIFIQRGNVLVEGNVIHDVGRYDPGENGCTYPSTFNKYKNSDTGVYLQSPNHSNITIRNNIFYNHRNGWGIYIYQGGPQNVRILNNTFANGNPYWSYTHVFTDADLVDFQMRNNIFYDPAGGYAMAWDLEPLVNVVITNNVANGNFLLSGADGSPVTTLPPGMTESNNRFNTDPMFVNPATYDFHLRAGSPAIDWGMTLADVLRDIEWRTRPQGGGYDAGAYERVP